MTTRKQHRLRLLGRDDDAVYDELERYLLTAVCLRRGDEAAAVDFLRDTAGRLAFAGAMNQALRLQALETGQDVPEPFLADTPADAAKRLLIRCYGDDAGLVELDGVAENEALTTPAGPSSICTEAVVDVP